MTNLILLYIKNEKWKMNNIIFEQQKKVVAKGEDKEILVQIYCSWIIDLYIFGK